MNADSRVPTRATSNAPSRRPRGSSVRTRGSHTPSSSARHQRHSSLQTPQEHYQQQPHGFNNHPHLEGLPNCLCAACHIKGEFFPRREDGRIVLPPPWLLPSRPERLYSGPVAGRVSLAQTSGGAQVHVPSAQQPGVQGYQRESFMVYTIVHLLLSVDCSRTSRSGIEGGQCLNAECAC
jgi:hypothetical protein